MEEINGIFVLRYGCVDVCVGWVLVYMVYKKCFCFSNVEFEMVWFKKSGLGSDELFSVRC